MRLFSFVIALCFSTSALAQSNASSGNVMLPYCKAYLAREARSEFIQGVCAGSVAAQLFLAHGLNQGLKSCPPDEATVDQAARVVVAYMEAHPEKLHHPLQAIIVLAYMKAWPCP